MIEALHHDGGHGNDKPRFLTPEHDLRAFCRRMSRSPSMALANTPPRFRPSDSSAMLRAAGLLMERQTDSGDNDERLEQSFRSLKI
jgi:hypothetical protein